MKRPACYDSPVGFRNIHLATIPPVAHLENVSLPAFYAFRFTRYVLRFFFFAAGNKMLFKINR